MPAVSVVGWSPIVRCCWASAAIFVVCSSDVGSAADRVCAFRCAVASDRTAPRHDWTASDADCDEFCRCLAKHDRDGLLVVVWLI